MKKEELFNIIGEVDEQKVAAAGMAMNTKKKSRPVWVKWGAMAACLCLVVGLAIPMLNNDYSDENPHSGLDSVKNPVYNVVEYTVPASYKPADLYISTTTDLAEYDTHMAKYNGDKFMGKGIRVFTFVEGATTENFNVWYFDYEGTNISRIYFVTKSGDKLVTAWTEAGELGKAIEALASETSADTPMYLVQDNEILYAVIGKTAYYLPDTAMKPEVSQMPEINTEGLDINTIILLSGECLELPDIERTEEPDEYPPTNIVSGVDLDEPSEVETVKYLDKTLNKSDLSAETLEWLEWFNGLSETGQLSVSFVPQEILELCGYVSTKNSEVSGPTD